MKNTVKLWRLMLDAWRGRPRPAGRPALLGVALCALLAGALTACGKGSSADPPTTVTVVPGDGQLTVSWNGDPSVDWWLFYGPDASLTLDNWTTITGSRALQTVASPRVVTGLTNGTAYTVIVNGRTSGGKGGPGSVPVFATPRPAGEGWTAGTTLATTSVNAIARTASLFVAVGNGGAIFTSPDGATWTPQSSGTTADLLAVSFNTSGRVTAVGSGGTVVSSLDAVTWAAQDSATTVTLRGLTPYLGGYLMVGDGGFLARGDNTTWTPSATGTTATLYAVANINNSTFVAVGAGGVARYSTNLIDWSAVNTGVTSDLLGLTVSPTLTNRIVVVGRGGAITTSLDGQTWTATTPVTTADLTSVVYASRFVGVGSTGAVVRSDDGLTWTTATSGTTADLKAVTFGAGLYLAGGSGGVTRTSQ